METKSETKYSKYGKDEYWIYYREKGSSYWMGTMFTNREEAEKFRRQKEEQGRE